jgi:hypothetical protein
LRERRELIVRRRRASVGLYIHSAAWAKQQEKEKEPSNIGEKEMENNRNTGYKAT